MAPATALDRPNHRPPSPTRSFSGGQPPIGDLYPDAHRPRLGRAVLRARSLSRRTAHGVDPFAGGLPIARCSGADLEARSGGDFGEARPGSGLLRPQRRRRRGGRRGGHRVSPAGAAGQGALAARGGIRLRAGQPGDGGDGQRRARRRAAAGRLDHRDLERPAHQPSGRRRQSARRRSPAEPATRAARFRIVISAGRRHPQRRAALRFPGQAHPPSPDRRNAGADLVIARARRDIERLRDRILHGRIGRAGRHGPGRLPAVGSVGCAGPGGRRTCRPPRRLASRTAAGHGTRPRDRLSRATRTSPPTPPSSPRSRSTKLFGCCACGARRMPGSSSTPTARSTSSKAASSRRRAGP